MRSILGIFSTIWAGSAPDNAVIPTGMADGFGSEYAVDTAPDRRNMNDVLAKATAVCTDVNKFGAALPWDTGITYEQYSPVVGSDGAIYIAQIQNAGQDPVSAGPTFWKTLAEVLGITALKTDVEYIPFSSHALDLTQNANGEWEYDVADFVGGGLDPDEIRTLHISVSATGRTDEGQHGSVEATMPNGDWTDLNNTDGSGGNDFESFARRYPVAIPINKNQTSISLRLSGPQPSEFTILGATQRTI